MPPAKCLKNKATRLLAPEFEQWFTRRGWRLRSHQEAVLRAYERRESLLLVAPTGAGKTLAGFLPVLQDLVANPSSGLHTLYISPLKALTQDVQRNLLTPVRELGLDVRIESRTGDTSSYQRQRQKKRPPQILLTTPESLMLMLSYPEAPALFSGIKALIVDEVHAFGHSKRGDFTALALAQLRDLAPGAVTVGLTATVADPDSLAAWLGPAGSPASVHQADAGASPRISRLKTRNRIPHSGYLVRYAIPEIYAAICEAGCTLVFVNTRAQAEWLFQMLWEANQDGLPIAVYHSALSREQRQRTEVLMGEGKLRAIVATSALELGVDWGNVDRVIQVGAPKGISRMLQRLGRANHRLDEPSESILVPSNRFEVLECHCAQQAAEEGALDGPDIQPGALDVIPQFIINRACMGPFKGDDLFRLIRSAWPYRELPEATYQRLLQFTRDGGYALAHYERHQRLELLAEDEYELKSARVAQRHRQNIGTITEAARLRVRRLGRGKRGKVVGEIEEAFVQQLTAGDTFLFAGEVLAFEGVRDMFVEARPVPFGEAKIPSFVGGQMPLSTQLAERVRALLESGCWPSEFPREVTEWLELQGRVSRLPSRGELLVESFPWRQREMLLLYTFEGRPANQTLGFILTRALEENGFQPIHFSVTDYALSIACRKAINEPELADLLAPQSVAAGLEQWLAESPMLKRSFRRVATVSGLTEKQLGGRSKTLKQMTFSTDLIYDVLRDYEPDHILLAAARQDAERELLDWERLRQFLASIQEHWSLIRLDRPSPLAIPVMLDVRQEAIRGAGVDALLNELSREDEAEALMQAQRDSVSEMDGT